MICPPCTADDHDNCLTAKNGREQLGLGLSRSCDCWEHSEAHVVRAKVALPARSNWSDEEIRDHEHDTGEDEFDTWIARSQQEMED